ncbi:uncharacterized protein LOC113355784 isoform X2 [Papaver somniferum]|uniref:uncharacterized protein LOC113355784 isoform X2 n=1 Tax=Papaver somniferum TaxID=3469 RepID=UPI000E6F5547|nr:uncharacterized protein LOC113355784 isoform X2 [Papaver somniferum]
MNREQFTSGVLSWLPNGIKSSWCFHNWVLVVGAWGVLGDLSGFALSICCIQGSRRLSFNFNNNLMGCKKIFTGCMTFTNTHCDWIFV